jgi:multiple sugar transport system permease protein
VDTDPHPKRSTCRADLFASIGGSPDRNPRSGSSRLGRLRPASILAFVFLGGFLVAMLFPIYWIIVSSVKTRIDTLALPPVWLFPPTLEAYRRVFIDEHYSRYFVNTAVIAAATTLISLAVGSMAAYVLDRFRIRFSNLIAYALLGTRMIFPIVYAIPLFLVFRDLNLLDTHLGLIIAYTTFSLPYAVWIMAGFFAAVPREIDEAAMVDGCSRFGAFCRVILPLTAPGLAAATIYILLLSWNEFMFALVLAGGGVAKTLPVAAAQLIGQREIQWNELCAVSTAAILPLLIFFALVNKYLVRGMIAGAVKS